MSRPLGRPLKPRTDTERLDLLEKLVGFGRARSDVGINWDDGPLALYVGPTGHFQKLVVDDANGSLRALLDRAISKHAGAKKRAKRKSRK